MAEFDKLEINIKTDAEKAASSIQNLSKNLNNLDKSLNLKNADKLSGISKEIRTMASNLGKQFNFKKDDIDELAVALDNIKNRFKDIDTVASQTGGKVGKNLVKGLNEAGKVAEETVKKFSRFKAEGNPFAIDLRKELKGQKISVSDLVSNGEAKGDRNFADLRNNLNKELGEVVFTLEKYTEKIEEHNGRITRSFKEISQFNLADVLPESFINGLNLQDTTSQIEQLDTILNALQQNDSSVLSGWRDKILSFAQASKAGITSVDELKYALSQFYGALSRIGEEEAIAENGIWKFVNSFKALKGEGIVTAREVAGVFRQITSDAFKMDITPHVNLENIKMLPSIVSDITAQFRSATDQGVKGFNDNLAITVGRLDDVLDRVYALGDSLRGQLALPDKGKQEIIDVGYQEIPFDSSDNLFDIDTQINKIVDSYHKANEAQSKFGNFSFAKVSAGLLAVSVALDKIGKGADKLGNLGIRLLGIAPAINRVKGAIGKLNLFTPLIGVVNEYKEKFAEIGKLFVNFRKKAQQNLEKLSAFWKRTMKTFTFMMIRKAITAILMNINEATKSLALFSQEVGTKFNENMSNLVADLKWIAKAIVGAFEPIINYVVPVLNRLSAALVNVITKLGEFFAALTGQKYYMVAKKKVEDFAGSLKKAAKEAKKSIRPFDELNLITSGNNGNTEDTGLNPMEDWDMKPVSDKMKKFADMVKDLAKKLWEPIKKAWDRTKDYVISGFKYMVEQLGKLGKDIGRDFLKVWRQEATVKMFENIFKIVGDIERVIGNLAKRFDEAWNEGSKGLHIFENIRDIFAILIQHIRNVTEYMIGWSNSIDFNPLLEGVEKLTNSLKGLADFIGGVFEDVMRNVVLKYIQWMIEEGAPHFLETVSEIIDAFDFDKIRADLVVFENAFESMLENIHTGTTNAIGFLGKTIAEWTNSDKFTKFMESLAHIMEQITAERVEKILEGLGLAILHIAEAVADFVSSDKFLGFIDSIGEWIDKSSPEDIAEIVEGIIKLTVALKGIGLIAPKVAGALKGIAAIKFAGNIGKIAKGLSGAGTVAKGVKAAKGAGDLIELPGLDGTGLTATQNALTKIQLALEKVGSAAKGAGAKFTSAFSTISWSEVLFGDMGANLAAGGATAGATIATGLLGGIAAAIGGWNLGQLIDKKLNDDNGMGTFTEQMKGIKDSFSDGSWKDALNLWGQDLAQGWKDIGEEIKTSDFGEWVGEKWQGLSEKATQLKNDVSGAFSLMGEDISTALEPITSRAGKAFEGIGIIIKSVFMTIVSWINTNVIIPVSKFFVTLSHNIQSTWSSIVSWFNTTIIQPLVTAFNTCVTTIQQAFTTAWTTIQGVWNTVTSWFNTTIIQPVVSAFTVAVTTIKNAFTTAWTAIQTSWSAAFSWFNSTIIQPIKSAFIIAINAIKSAFNAAWSAIKAGAKAAFNAVIGGVEKAINGMISGINNVFLKTFNAIVSKAAQITGDNWTGIELIPKISLPRYATGGFPKEDGLFMANHSELIGQFSNGQTAVANNEQIIEGIKAGVIDGMMQILPSLAQAVSNDSTVEITGDMSKFFRAVVKENYGANKRTFNSSPLYG